MRRWLVAFFVAGVFMGGCGERPAGAGAAGNVPTPGQPYIIPGLGLELMPIPAGTFQMGSMDGDDDGYPVHEVRLTKAFWLGKTEVTQAQWEAVMGTSVRRQRNRVDPRWPWRGGGFPRLSWRGAQACWRELTRPRWPLAGEGADYPIYYVSWEEAMAFCRKLTEREQAAGRLPAGSEYRLPTEAEWEYACRAGSTTRYCFDDDEGPLGEYAWYAVNSGGQTHEVATRKPNGWGLHDLHGNVWEWCLDWYDEAYYARSPGTDPANTETGSIRVNRGGGWYDTAPYCRSANRDGSPPGYTCHFLGFRVALAPAVRR